MSILGQLGIGVPVVAAPMAGGPSTPELVIAAGAVGAVGFLAGGYKTAADLGVQVEQVRAAGVPFGVNLFVPTPVPVDPGAYAAYAEALREVAAPYGVDPTAVALREDDDDWDAKVALLLEHPVPVVSFVFGVPPAATTAALRSVGTLVLQTVTTLAEAREAVAAGADALIVQGAAAGGHSGTTTPARLPVERPLLGLVQEIGSAVPLPVWAAGGVGSAEQVAELLTGGAEAVVVGTVLLRSDESGASAAYRDALADPARTATTLTRAFSGRPARALRNSFVDTFDAAAPPGYPAVHHLTSPLRRAAAAAVDPENINIWAGTGFRDAATGPVGDILLRLAGRRPGGPTF